MDLSPFFKGHISSDNGDWAVLVVHKYRLLLSCFPYDCFAVFASMHGCIDGPLFVVFPMIFGITSPMTTVDHFSASCWGIFSIFAMTEDRIPSVSPHLSFCCSGTPRMTSVFQSCRFVLSSTFSSSARILSYSPASLITLDCCSWNLVRSPSSALILDVRTSIVWVCDSMI